MRAFVEHRRSFAALVAAAFACAGCPSRDPAAETLLATKAKPDATATAAPEAGSAQAEAGTDSGAIVSWQEAIRTERWKEAEAALEKLPANEQNAPETKLARARVARMLGKDTLTVQLLDKLEDELPLVREVIAKERALAAMKAGPADKAAEWLAARPQPSSWLLAAEAWDRAGETGRARAQCDRVLAAEKRTRSQEEKARALRLRIVREAKDESTLAADARWLAINALDSKTAATAQEVVDHLTPPKPLTADELATRARTLAEAGRADDALKMLDRANNAKGKLSEIDRCRSRAEVLYKARSRYSEAALAYRACSQLGGSHAAEDAFLSARAFSRADRDGDALPAFAAVMQRHPKTTWAEQSEFHIARTHALAGRWREAASAFDLYATHWGATAREKKEADRYRALVHLMAGDHKIARRLLEDLAGGESDSIGQARWINLAALAALRDGDRLHAVSRWSEVARSRPLSWPALVARARLQWQNAPLPPVIEPSDAKDLGNEPAPLDVSLPPPVDMLHRIGLDGDAEEALRERETAVAARAPGRGTEALCRAYAALDRGKRRYQLSRDVPGALLNTAPGPKNRWAWDCAFPRPHEAQVTAEASDTKLPTSLLWAVMRQESAFDPEVVSPARAVGLLQLMPETARAVANAAGLPHEEAWLVRPGHNVTLGARYLRELLDKLNGNTSLATGAYNAGPEAITRWENRAKGGTLDVFVEMIPFLETRGYVVRVMGNLARYGYLAGGEAGVPEIALDLK